MKRWFKPEEVAQKACPLSVGQAEAGRYTFCVADKCMAWDWGFKEEDKSTMLESDELPEGWQRDHAVAYVPVLSDVADGDVWNGRRGLVHQAVMEDLPDLSGYEVYACGAPAMVEAARRDFTTRCGLPEAAFYADAFTPAVPATN